MHCLLGGLQGGQDGVLPEARPEVRGQGEPSQLWRGPLTLPFLLLTFIYCPTRRTTRRTRRCTA